ncbi:hypothetical protein J8273_0282 [Carpediemonas membranifera]|uniref:Uncharacterized protein n=1 Tax=Carpediemonas membranifera TaxID=201153 RepID=A0A8J6E327_9EUKA|nr:hypothetical protein J8273_0282 [Carpediemonas membranifera]|eukprot:KAG9395066.1 hypothetical protein J8273_0282 [Carpediemonas membranifera]
MERTPQLLDALVKNDLKLFHTLLQNAQRTPENLYLVKLASALETGFTTTIVETITSCSFLQFHEALGLILQHVQASALANLRVATRSIPVEAAPSLLAVPPDQLEAYCAANDMNVSGGVIDIHHPSGRGLRDLPGLSSLTQFVATVESVV